MSPEARRFIMALLPQLDEFYSDFSRYVNAHWDASRYYFPLTELEYSEKEQRGENIVERLQTALPVAEMARAATEIIAAPDEAKATLQELDTTPEKSARQQLIYRVARRGLVQEMAFRALKANPHDEAVQYLADRVRVMMALPYDHGNLYRGHDPWNYHHSRCLVDYWALLAALMPHPAAVQLVRDVLTGTLQIAAPVEPRAKDTFSSYLHNSSYARRDLLREFHRCDLLDYALFCAIANYEPQNLRFGCSTWDDAAPGTFEHTMKELNQTWSREVAADFKPENIGFAMRNFYWLKGAYFLLRACENVEKFGLKKLLPFDYNDKMETAIGRLAHITDWEEGDNPDEIVAQLRQFKPAALEIVLPVAGVGQELVLRALHRENLLPLLQLVKTISGYAPRKYSHEWDIKNSADETSGVLNVPQVHAVLQQAGENDAKLLFTGLRQAKMGLDNTVLLLESVTGSNRADLLKKLEKRHQTAVKAFGLLPLQNGDSEALERYLWLRRFAKESKQFGSQRRAAEAAAVAVALANLAQVAGYADTTQLEWAMEVRLAQGNGENAAARAAIGDYELEVAFVGEEAKLFIRRDGKTLKTPPSSLRAEPEYGRLKELQAQLKSQRTRFRATLENLMAEARAMTPAEIARLATLPAARPLLLALIWADGEGHFGLFDDDFSQLRDANAGAWQASNTLFLAHPLDLFEAGELAAWQRVLVQKRLVQPFRQAFRELYVLTPAERQTGTFSNRFAGHVVEPRRAARLLGGRGWNLHADDEFSVPEKVFQSAGLRACFDFADVGHFFTETDSVTSDAVYFMPLELPRYWNRQAADLQNADPRVPLENVPPKIFSETMRDADLVVSVAQLGEGGTLSGEAFERRGDVVRSLIEDLGLPGVRISGHFAHVAGKLTNYRVHLASGVIHIEPGNYLCIVPERAAPREKLFLPFADEDAKMSEVISKIMLLLRDDKITDETILRQIKAAQGLFLSPD